MVFELTEKNLSKIDNSFLKKDIVLENLRHNPFGRYMVLQEKEEIIGYIYYSDIYERAEINQIEIVENYRHQQKGTKLLQFFLQFLKKDVTLEVRIDNIPAIKLYEKCGFKKIAIRQNYYNGIDGILMERKYK